MSTKFESLFPDRGVANPNRPGPNLVLKLAARGYLNDLTDAVNIQHKRSKRLEQ